MHSFAIFYINKREIPSRMDEEYRALEREAAGGDALVTRRLAALERRRGTPSKVLERLTFALAQAPSDEDLQKEYRAAKGFWIERARDEILGDAFLYENMNFNGQSVTFLRKNEGRTHGWLFREEQSKTQRTTAEFEYATRACLYANRNHPALAETIKDAITSHKLEFVPETALILAEAYAIEGQLHIEEPALFGQSGQRTLAYPTQHAPGHCHFILCDCPDHRTGDAPPQYLDRFLRGLLGEQYVQGLLATREIHKKPGRHVPITLTLLPPEEITEDNFRLVARKGMTKLSIENPHTLQNEIRFRLSYTLIRPINSI